MEFFKGIQTEEDLKKTYRRLVKLHHPDKGGSNEIMKMINYQYARYQRAFSYKPKSLKEVKPGCFIMVNDSKCIVTKVEANRFKARSLKTFRETYFSKDTGFAFLNFKYKANVL